jgi:hypothetical protein
MRQLHPWWIAGRAAIAASMLAGCGGGSGDSPKAALAACSLVTAADIQEATGTPTGAGNAITGERGVTTCSYSAQDGSHTILVRVSSGLGEQEHAAFPFAESEPVAGLGDDAKFAQQAKPAGETAAGDFGSALSVLKGKVEISIYYTGQGDRLSVSKTLAERALARL